MPSITQTCSITGKNFEVSEAYQEHLHRIGTLHPYVKEPIPLPIIHPYEHQRRFWSFGNLIHLYNHKSAISGTHQLSRIPPDFGHKICTMEEFWSDVVDNREFGQDYDFNKPLYVQLNELALKTYNVPLNNTNNENCEYTNGTFNSKNCFFTCAASNLEECMFCYQMHDSKNCLDCIGVNFSEYCYSSTDCERCYACQHSQDLKNCIECIACLDCTSCQNCFGCVGLSHKEYYVFNEQKTKEEYELYIASLQLHTREGRSKALTLVNSFIESQQHTVNRLINCENCTGSYITNSKNIVESYTLSNSEHCAYLFGLNGVKNSWLGAGINTEMNYASLNIDGRNALFTYGTIGGENCLYSYFLYQNCSNCFGCVALKNNSYCILNKQYTKEEYEELVPRIIAHMKSTGEWGSMIHPSISYNTYHESVVPDYLEPISDEEIKRRGYRTTPTAERGIPAGAVEASSLPINITDVQPHLVMGKVYLCETTKKPFTFQAKELAFYKRYNIPLPTIQWKKRIQILNSKRDLIPAV